MFSDFLWCPAQFLPQNLCIFAFHEQLESLENVWKCGKFKYEEVLLSYTPTVFENHRKSRIQHGYIYILSGQKLIKKWKKKRSVLVSIWKPEICSQIVLPDRSILIEQKLLKEAKMEKFKCDILRDF